MLAKMNELKSKEGMRPSTTASLPTVQQHYSPSNWTTVARTFIGTSLLQEIGTFSFDIPSIIPSDAKEVLIYGAFYAGTNDNNISLDIKCFTEIGTTRYEKYIYLLTWNQNAINSNSDNMWFPMPPDRRFYMTVPIALPRGSQHGGALMYVIGYR